jgi:isoleucyl-tRNA synthetase/very-short-patch-repair endonuclease
MMQKKEQKNLYPEANQNIDFAKLEEDILKFWQEEKIFEKSIEIRNFSSDLDEDNTSPALENCALKNHDNCRHNLADERDEFVFYDGPPFANGLPHYGHLLTGFIKDIFARYQTMKGKKVERRFGWDTHGLPVEMETEKFLTAKENRQISGQIAIKEYGIEKFNAACEESVMKYANEWEHYVRRQGRFVDFKNSYKTKDLNYMESVIWAFKQLFDKGLIYEDFRVVPYSWACQTPLSNFETKMDNAYRQKTSKAVTVKFELTDESAKKLGFEGKKVSLIAWTTTPWTLPSNLALGVGRGIVYAALEKSNEILITSIRSLNKKINTPGPALSLNEFERELFRLKSELESSELPQEYVGYEVLKVFSGHVLLESFRDGELNLKYKPLFPYLSQKAGENAFKILHGDFVSTDAGTGIVHLAPGFGEDDQLLCKANGIPTLCPVDEAGKFSNEIYDLKFNPTLSQLNGKDSLLRGEFSTSSPSPLRGEFSPSSPSPLMGEGWGEGEENKIPNLTNLAKNLRKNQTEAESKLWNSLRNNQLQNFEFRRQHQIGNYIADFICLEKKLIIELDGGQHNEEEGKIKDEKRTAFLTSEGFRVLRFWNNEIFENIEGVVDSIYYNLIHPHPTLSPQGRGLERENLSPQGRGLERENLSPQGRGLERENLSYQERGLKEGNLCYQERRLEGRNLSLQETEKGNFSPQLLQNKENFFSEKKINYLNQSDSVNNDELFNNLSLKGRQVFETNDDIIKYLKAAGAWVKTEQYLHDYPHCWRTDTPLIYKAVSSWYVKVTDIKDRMVELNKEVNWIPSHIQSGQFGKWLEGARDWSITRNRFWGCPVPVWRSKSGKIKVCGSIAEIEELSGKKITNLHRPFIDEITFEIDGEIYQRVEDVLDCWFESGSMPYGQAHYPFENKEWFERNFPADFITEYVAQTRGWFYTLFVLSTAIFDRAPFKNVICHGTILDEKAQKLSKRLKNYADPIEIFSTYGSDAMRFYMISQPVMRGQELKIDKDGKAIRDTLRLSIKPLINAFNFFCLYANADKITAKRIEIDKDFSNILDRYILTKLKEAVLIIDSSMKNYDTVSACDQFNKFFEVLNNWYIRRSRQRFWKTDQDIDKQNAYDVLYTVLIVMCESAAPLLPFTTEYVWKSLN